MRVCAKQNHTLDVIQIHVLPFKHETHSRKLSIGWLNNIAINLCHKNVNEEQSVTVVGASDSRLTLLP